MLLCRPQRGGLVPRKDLELARAGFAQHPLGKASFPKSGAKTSPISDTVEARAVRAEKFVQLGEISAGRQVLESARVAPGTLATLCALTNQQRRPPVPREPVLEGLADVQRGA